MSLKARNRLSDQLRKNENANANAKWINFNLPLDLPYFLGSVATYIKVSGVYIAQYCVINVLTQLTAMCYMAVYSMPEGKCFLELTKLDKELYYYLLWLKFIACLKQALEVSCISIFCLTLLIC